METFSIYGVCDYLNDLLDLDRSSISEIFTNQILVNAELENVIIVNQDGKTGPLGILNGLFINSENVIVKNYDEETGIVSSFSIQPKLKFA